jgi:hypothetical protein
MNQEIMEFCKIEINDLLGKKIIRHSKSPWSCPAFYVQKNAELERGAPRLVINYKPLNKVLEWIRYPIPNKQDLINRLSDSIVFSKFDLKSEFWQIQIHEDDKYKTPLKFSHLLLSSFLSLHVPCPLMPTAHASPRTYCLEKGLTVWVMTHSFKIDKITTRDRL